MKKLLVVFYILILSACLSKPVLEVHNKFLIEFGHIVEVGEFYEIRPNMFSFYTQNGKLLNKFGVRIENLARLDYELAYVIAKYQDETGGYEIFARGCCWSIKPPTNSNYEAFIWEEDAPFFPGNYKFAVFVNNEIVEMIDFEVIEIEI